MTVGQKIRTRRKELHISQSKLAEMIGMSSATPGRIERGETIPNRSTLRKIEVALGFKPETLRVMLFTENDLARAMAFAAKNGIDYFYSDYCEGCKKRHGNKCPFPKDGEDCPGTDTDVFEWWVTMKCYGEEKEVHNEENSNAL